MENTIKNHDTGMKSTSFWLNKIPIAGAALLVLLALWIVISQVTATMAQKQLAVDKAAFEEVTGIRVVRIVVTAGGGIIDLQYQVVDPDKALKIHDADNPPMILDRESNLIFANPFHEHAARELHTGVTYHTMIMNGGGLLQRGSRITLKVGESLLENLVIE